MIVGKEYDVCETNQGRNDRTDHSNTFLLGALIGGLAGAAAALLFAPRSGKEFRSRLLDRTVLVSENVLDKRNGLTSYIKMKAPHVDLSEYPEDENTNYISLDNGEFKTNSNHKEKDIRRKLEEAKLALEEEEKRVME